MTRIFAPVVALALSLILAIASVNMASMDLRMARGADGEAVVLCGTDTEVIVQLPGRPVSPDPAHLCPDCLLHGDLALWAIPGAAAATQRIGVLVGQGQGPTQVHLQTILRLQARAPPVLI